MSCLPLLQKNVNGNKFKDRICEIPKGGFTDCTLSGIEVYNIFMRGRQVGEITEDFEMDIDLTIYSARFSSTVGYTYPSTVKTWINRKFFSVYTTAEICGNISHEYCHKLGFAHKSKWSKSRDMSVPYFIGYLIAQIIEEELNEFTLAA
jgi:hypothetical protein